MHAITRAATAAVMLGALLGAAPLGAAPIETGRQIADVNGAPMVVFTYRPAGCSDPSLLLVFHGIARNARTYRDDARALADRLCLLVVAPLFDRQAFPGWRYQRGGIVNGAAVQDARDFTGRLVLDLIEGLRLGIHHPILVTATVHEPKPALRQCLPHGRFRQFGYFSLSYQGASPLVRWRYKNPPSVLHWHLG